MSLGAEAWWAAMLGADQFEDGSLVIEDDTLDVDGGDTVNLRVKLGARPRSDVTVALAETSSLISLGEDELTFTPDNWDTYQSVVVTATGNSQSIALTTSVWRPDFSVEALTSVVGWSWPFNTRPEIIPALGSSSETPLLSQVGVQRDGSVGSRSLGIQLNNTQTGTADREDLSDAFEASGSVAFTIGASTWLFPIAGADTAEPYWWEPANQADVEAFRTAILSAAIAGTITIRDYVPADATISLSASGPDEYSGVTGSATVSVN